MREEIFYLNKCKDQIVSRLNWPEASEWKHRDYEALSKLIFDKSGTILSASTLKRIFKDDYSSTPHPATLDAFASFLEFHSWAEFKMSISPVEDPKQKIKTSIPIKNFSYKKIFFPVGIVIPIIILAYIFFQPDSTAKFGKDISFSTKKVVSAGVPNTVVFNYDIQSTVFDSAFIQQSWDTRRRSAIKKEDNYHTSVYYYPGYHKAKLMLDDEIVRETNIHITTEGWQTIARKKYMDLIPVYIPKNDVHTEDSLYVSPVTLTNNKLVISDNDFFVSYYNVNDFGNVMGNNFTLQAEIKNALKDGALTGQYAQIIVMTENGRIISTFSDKGVIGNISQSFLDKFISGKTNDLSMFGCNMELWNKVKIDIRKKETRIYLNDEFIFSDYFTKDAGRVIGIHFMFRGCGKVRNVILDNNSLL